jgi:hypothetical protein
VDDERGADGCLFAEDDCTGASGSQGWTDEIASHEAEGPTRSSFPPFPPSLALPLAALQCRLDRRYPDRHCQSSKKHTSQTQQTRAIVICPFSISLSPLSLLSPSLFPSLFLVSVQAVCWTRLLVFPTKSRSLDLPIFQTSWRNIPLTPRSSSSSSKLGSD